MVNFNDIQIFVLTAQTGTVNAAARSLGVPGSTVSRAITRLEKEINLQLIRRTHKGVILTDVGRDYLEKCRSAVEQLDAAHETLGIYRRKPRGLIRLAVTTAFARDVLTPVLKKFVAQYPEIRLQIIFHGGKFSTSLEDNLDFYFQIGKPKDSPLKVKVFSPILRGIYASPSYIAANGKPEKPEDLREHLCIGYTPKETAVWRLQSGSEKQSVRLALRVSVADPVIHTKLTLDGLGIAELPIWTAKPEVAAGKLVEVLSDWKPESLHFHALYAERKSMTPKVKIFLEFVESFISTEFDPRTGDNSVSEVFQVL